MPNHAYNLLNIHIAIQNRHTPSTEKRIKQGKFLISLLSLSVFFLIQCKHRLILEQYPVYVSTQWCYVLLEAGIRVADMLRSFGCDERMIYRLLTRFRQSGSKNDKPPSRRPRIKTPLEVKVKVTST